MQVIICDGSSYGNPGHTKIGIIIWERFSGKSSSKRVLPTKIISEDTGIGTNNDAEWKAVIEAMRYINNKKGSDPVFIYSDSLLVVNQINNLYKVKHENMKKYKSIFDNLHNSCMARRQEITVTWLPRQLTILADKQT